MNAINKPSPSDLEQYRITAQAIGLVELLGNAQPNNSQVRMAEKLVSVLGLSWEACANQQALLRALKINKCQTSDGMNRHICR